LCSAGLAPILESDVNAEIVPGSYLVIYKDEAPADVIAKDILVAAGQYEVMHHYTTVVKGYAAKLTDEQVEAVRANQFVSYIEKDQKMYASACTTTRAGKWGQTRVAETTTANYNDLYGSPNNGEGTFVYIVDTGIYVANTDFGGRATFAYKADSKWSDTDGNGHGTHVASITAGSVYGIANAATIFAVKVLGDDGSGTTTGVIGGVDWAVGDATSRGAKKCVLNLSLGGGRSTTMNNAVNGGVALDVVVVVAAGNDDGDACAGSPSGAGDVITVGSTEQSPAGKPDARSWFSNWGICVNVFAPGTSITAAWIGSTGAINTISGTSMASPNVAGIAAILRSTHPSSTAKHINTLIEHAATKDVIDFKCTKGGTCASSPNLLANNGCQIA
jgi:subtilisin family serine protease